MLTVQGNGINFHNANAENTFDFLILRVNFCSADDVWVLQSSGDQNYERVEFTVTSDNFRFRVKACSDVWVTVTAIPGDYAVSRYLKSYLLPEVTTEEF